MAPLTSVLLFASLQSLILASPINSARSVSNSGFRVSRKSVAGTQAATPDEVTDAHLVLTRRTSANPRSFQYINAIRSGKQKDGVYQVGSAPLTPTEGGTGFDVQIQFANSNPVDVIVDTGSSDTWLAQAGFQCVDANGNDVAESTCDFGPLFNGTFEEGQIADENFNIEYGDGEILNGVLGHEDVTVAGITVKDQEVALVNYAYWLGDGVSSGLLGLAYPSLTSAFEGTNPANDNTSTNVEYNSIFTTMINESLVAPSFSLAIERAPAGGYIAFGGLPPVSFDRTFTNTPIEIMEIVDDPVTAVQYSFYTITPTGFVFGGSGGRRHHSREYGVESDFPTIVDSGTTLVYLPDELADIVNSFYEPQAVFLEDEGAYFVDCQAAAPEFGVDINGTIFNVNAADLIFQSQVDPQTGLCLTGIQEGGEGPFVLGDVFLQNVVAVFDVGAAEMRFAAHENY